VSIDPSKYSAEELLQALVVGDVDPHDAQVSARFAAEPDLAARWEQLAATLAVLRDVEGEPEPPPGLAPAVRPLDTMAAIRMFRHESERQTWNWRRLIPAAALVAAAVFVVWWLQPRPTEPIDPVLGDPSAMTLTPRGSWPEGVPLRWTAVRGADGYRLELEPPPPFAVGSLTTLEWLPSPDQLRQLPTRFRWRVNAYAGEDYLGTSGWADTWR
jgi:hypothetical protein